MKKIFTIVSVVAAILAVNAQTNLLTNPDFETGNTTGWAVNSTAGSALPQVLNTAGMAHGGTYYAEYSYPSVGSGGTTQTYGFNQTVATNITPGSTYTVSFWYKASGDGTDGRIWCVWKDSTGNFIYQNGASAATGDVLRGPNNSYLPSAAAWTQYSVDVVAPANVVSFLFETRAYSSKSANVVVDFDDMFFGLKNSLATDEASAVSKHALIKNTVVKENLVFATKSAVQIFDMNGKMVKQSNAEQDSVLDVSNLPKGLYIVKGIANGEKSGQKFMKQ